MAAQSQNHYMAVLGVKPGATLDEIHTAYYLMIEKYSHDPTEEEAEEQQRLQHAYNVLRRSYDDSAPAPRPRRESSGDSRALIKVAALLLLVVLPVFVAMNWSAIKLGLADVEPGTVIRLEGSSTPYGTVLRFDDQHRFHTGEPTPAYEIRLAATGETVWLSKRVVVKGMVPVEEPAAGD